MPIPSRASIDTYLSAIEIECFLKSSFSPRYRILNRKTDGVMAARIEGGATFVNEPNTSGIFAEIEPASRRWKSIASSTVDCDSSISMTGMIGRTSCLVSNEAIKESKSFISILASSELLPIVTIILLSSITILSITFVFPSISNFPREKTRLIFPDGEGIFNFEQPYFWMIAFKKELISSE